MGYTSPDSGAATSAVAPDEYALTVPVCSFSQGMNETATFALSVRIRSPERRALAAVGPADALASVERVRFNESDV